MRTPDIDSDLHTHIHTTCIHRLTYTYAHLHMQKGADSSGLEDGHRTSTQWGQQLPNQSSAGGVHVFWGES